MDNQTQRRHLAGWITAAAAATAVFTIGGVATSVAAVEAVTTALSSASTHSTNERAGYDPYSGSAGQASGGSTGSGGQGAAATAAQERGVVIIDTVLQYAGAQAAGTGVVLTSNGEVLTNNHVIEGSTSISVTVASTGKSYAASVVGTDATDDIAVLQLSGVSGLATASLAAAGGASVGEAVTAVGNAGGTGTLTAATGSVTGIDKTITTQAEASAASETLSGLIETNADIQAGDSGGPLYDASGDVIGIDTAASSNSAVPDGYAIPIGNALTVADQIESGDASDTVVIGLPAFLGVEVATDASGYGNGSGTGGLGYSGSSGNGYPGVGPGARIAQVIAGTAAASAGLEAGDTITAVDGAAISSPEDLTAVLAQLRPGSSATVVYTDAGGASRTVTVTLGSGPAA